MNQPLWMEYGGLLRSTPNSPAIPNPRFMWMSTLWALSFPNVNVPLIVMLPLGPHMVAL